MKESLYFATTFSSNVETVLINFPFEVSKPVLSTYAKHESCELFTFKKPGVSLEGKFYKTSVPEYKMLYLCFPFILSISTSSTSKLIGSFT